MSQPLVVGGDAERAAVLTYLCQRGVLPSGTDIGAARVAHLTGGVSGEAVLIEVGSLRVVMKRALDKLLVEADWYAKPERAVTEAAALELVHFITPHCTPDLLDINPELFTLVMTAADARWSPWKSRLLDAPLLPDVEIAVGATLGSVLGRWHAATADDAAVAERFNDREAFEQLRIGPFHRVIARRHPDVAAAVNTCIADLETRRDCLIHGDYSPKNVLVGPAELEGDSGRDGLMVVDFEVACVSASVFDGAFMNCHLLLKAVHRPGQRTLFRRIARAFLDAYAAQIGAEPGPRLGWHTACLLLARVDGTSPSGYLDQRGEAVVRELALAALAAESPTINELWDLALDMIDAAGADE